MLLRPNKYVVIVFGKSSGSVRAANEDGQCVYVLGTNQVMAAGNAAGGSESHQFAGNSAVAAAFPTGRSGLLATDRNVQISESHERGTATLAADAALADDGRGPAAPCKQKDSVLKTLALLVAVVVVIVVSGCAGVDSRAATQSDILASAQSPTADPALLRAALLARLRTFALKGDLFDPNATASLLALTLQAETSDVVHLRKDCGDGTTQWAEVTTVTQSEPAWYRTLPSGAGHMPIPAFTINPATTTADPGVDYKVYHSVHCRDWGRMRDHRESHLWLTGLPAFTCLTPAQIKAEIPEAKAEWATDGVSFMSFDGRVDDDSAINLSFWFRAGAPCAISAEFRQDQEDGYRYHRAQYKYQACRDPSDREFCSAHPDVTWSNRDLLRQMVIQAYERCGTVDTFYAKEPSTGVPTPPIPRPRRNTPCDGL